LNDAVIYTTDICGG